MNKSDYINANDRTIDLWGEEGWEWGVPCFRATLAVKEERK